VTLGRIPIVDVRDLDDVIRFMDAGSDRAVIISDVDNTLVPQSVPLWEFAAMVNAAMDRLEAHRNVSRVIALTNGPERDVPRLMSRGNKPWTTKRRLGLRGSRAPIVVVGDQVLTDGLIAWRFRATFLHLVIDDEEEARRQAFMRWVGGRLISVLFRPTPMTACSASEDPS